MTTTRFVTYQEQVCVQHSTSPVNETLLVFAAERRAAAPWCCSAAAGRTPLSINISCRHGAQQQTRRTPRLRSHDGTDRRTDGRTLDRFIDLAQHTMREVSITDSISIGAPIVINVDRSQCHLHKRHFSQTCGETR